METGWRHVSRAQSPGLQVKPTTTHTTSLIQEGKQVAGGQFWWESVSSPPSSLPAASCPLTSPEWLIGYRTFWPFYEVSPRPGFSLLPWQTKRTASRKQASLLYMFYTLFNKFTLKERISHKLPNISVSGDEPTVLMLQQVACITESSKRFAITGLGGFTNEFYQILKEEINNINLKCFKKQNLI